MVRFRTQNASRPYSFGWDRESGRFRFELRSGDRPESNSPDTERSEISGPYSTHGADCVLAYSLNLVQPGAATWAVLGQYHGGSDTGGRNPYIAVYYESGGLYIREKHWNGTEVSPAAELFSWPSFPAGEDVAIRIEHKAHLTTGYIRLWVNHEQVADYAGPVGYTDEALGGYPKLGIYRSNDSETAIVIYSDVSAA